MVMSSHTNTYRSAGNIQMELTNRYTMSVLTLSLILVLMLNDCNGKSIVCIQTMHTY